MPSPFKNFIRRLIPKKVREFSSYQEGDEFSLKVYSQEGEDILLKRIFEHSPPGFYVDVGAHHPFRFSNTKLLYDMGWHGINIEPNPDATIDFLNYRPNDEFVNSGVSSVNGVMKYYEYGHPALNTFSDEIVANGLEKPISSKVISTLPLKEILFQHFPNGLKIDLLSIDAEGMDLEILQSSDWEKYPVRYVLVELPVLSISEALSNPITQYLEQKGFVMISKLWKTCFYEHRSETAP